jgi:hypothetical protein
MYELNQIPQIVTGYKAKFTVELTVDESSFPISDTATVKANLIKTDRQTVLIAAVTLNKDMAGADWANSVVTVEFPAADTSSIAFEDGEAEMDALVELSVADGGDPEPFFVVATVSKGTIHS